MREAPLVVALTVAVAVTPVVRTDHRTAGLIAAIVVVPARAVVVITAVARGFADHARERAAFGAAIAIVLTAVAALRLLPVGATLSLIPLSLALIAARSGVRLTAGAALALPGPLGPLSLSLLAGLTTPVAVATGVIAAAVPA